MTPYLWGAAKYLQMSLVRVTKCDCEFRGVRSWGQTHDDGGLIATS